METKTAEPTAAQLSRGRAAHLSREAVKQWDKAQRALRRGDRDGYMVALHFSNALEAGAAALLEQARNLEGKGA